ncbi:hypothetical protein BAE44_0022333 [Dichanthelium oligosanthes]|uniref:Disease resistance protein At4g27190-like leucine-rich repeats domain-containing protein n=1 Tax=Dichanthelium oligosanthes TaxID=888268 RepID=A0A1E5UV16_9POAL|nr:hypothetical protein BAE44_0022333 [Dichanthelium oligosanthes]
MAAAAEPSQASSNRADLSGNSSIQVLPTLSKATSLKTLVLDGCVGLEHVDPEGLPASLETFCLDAGSSGSKVAAKLSKISLAGCVHLKNFLLRGALPELEELNLSDFYVEIGEGISLTDMESNRAISFMELMMREQIDSLHVHGNSRILSVTHKLSSLHQAISAFRGIGLKWCRVERCPKLQSVFNSHGSQVTYTFYKLKTIWASDLLIAGCIWCKGTVTDFIANFKALQSIHLHNCPRLKYVLPFRSFTLPSLETLHITRCGDLRQVFPWDDVDVPQGRSARKFQKLKHINLYDLPNLQDICEGGMYAPVLESIKLRGCWNLMRLPVVDRDEGRGHRPVVHCEKDCWEKLEWDGLRAGHAPTLYELRQSSPYYKKRLLRGTVLR